MPAERKGLSGPTQLLLIALALSPGWYLLAGQIWSSPSQLQDLTPNYMWCPDCGLEVPCGPQGSPGMRCPRCAHAEATLVLRIRSGSSLWDMLVKSFIGLVAFLAVVVLVFGTHQPKRAVESPAAPKDPAARQAAINEIRDWARDLAENRRRRLEG